MQRNRSAGLWFLICFSIFMLVMLLLGQTMALIDYDFTVRLGLQESVEAVTPIGVALNKGFGAADTIIYVPLLILGLWGLIRQKPWGVAMMTAAMGVTAYWPLACLFFLFFAKGAPGFLFTGYVPYTILLTGISICGIVGFVLLCCMDGLQRGGIDG